MDTTVAALGLFHRFCSDMKENEEMCRRVLRRLELVSEVLQTIKDESVLRENQALPKFGEVIRDFSDFLKKHSRKSWLRRLRSNRKVAEKVQEIHTEIDLLFKLLNLVHIKEMSAWKDEWEQDRKTQHDCFEQQKNNLHLVMSERGGALVEALTELKYEIEKQGKNNSPEHVALMRETFMTVTRASKAKVPKIPKWFIPRDDVNCPKVFFKCGSYCTVHSGTWGKGTRVVIKRLLVDAGVAQNAFVAGVEIWSQLDHPHLIKLYGACHVGWPLFFVCEDATNGNFVDYFRDPSNKRYCMWRLFYEAALGLEYLHRNKIVHGELTCRNLLVGRDGSARISDFGFSFARQQTVSLSLKPLTDVTRWKALEILESGDDPTFASDVYAFGMCIIEAMSGEEPWGLDDDETFVGSLLKGNGHPRPDGFSDKQWELVSDLCKIDTSQRIELSAAITRLKVLADEEEREKCRSDTTSSAAAQSATWQTEPAVSLKATVAHPLSALWM